MDILGAKCGLCKVFFYKLSLTGRAMAAVTEWYGACETNMAKTVKAHLCMSSSGLPTKMGVGRFGSVP